MATLFGIFGPQLSLTSYPFLHFKSSVTDKSFVDKMCVWRTRFCYYDEFIHTLQCVLKKGVRGFHVLCPISLVYHCGQELWYWYTIGNSSKKDMWISPDSKMHSIQFNILGREATDTFVFIFNLAWLNRKHYSPYWCCPFFQKNTEVVVKYLSSCINSWSRYM